MVAHERIKITDTIQDSMRKLADGNFGALNVLIQILEKGGRIDPYAGGGEPAMLLLLVDSYALYGERLWLLYKDVCGQNLNKTIACLRGMQLGILNKEVLNVAVDNRGAGLDLEDVCNKVKTRLPDFQLE